MLIAENDDGEGKKMTIAVLVIMIMVLGVMMILYQARSY